jgi:hypothetical protein
VQALREAMTSLDDLGKRITYLKVDIEGYEIDAIPDWIDNGLTQNIDQVLRILKHNVCFF